MNTPGLFVCVHVHQYPPSLRISIPVGPGGTGGRVERSIWLLLMAQSRMLLGESVNRHVVLLCFVQVPQTPRSLGSLATHILPLVC